MAKRKPVMNGAVKAAAMEIISRRGLAYDGTTFKKEKSRPTYEWNLFWNHSFFSEAEQLRCCCGVLEMGECYTPAKRNFPDVPKAEWLVLFKYHVLDLLEKAERRMALVTLANYQKSFVPFLQAAGFELVSTGFNPGTNRRVTIWVLSI